MTTDLSAHSPRTAGSAAFPVFSDPTLHLPRILCLHGGGTNARIFRAQCRSISALLHGHFRLVFADAPFPSQPGPDVESVYAEWGPFRSWVRPRAGGRIPTIWSPESVDVDAVDVAITNAITADNSVGATGRVVGLLGFSQGAKMAACLLLRQQQENERRSQLHGHMVRSLSCTIEYQFAALFAGRGPLVVLDQERGKVSQASPNSAKLRLPTIHVHGKRDPGLPLHQELLQRHCAQNTTQLIEWEGGHRIPIKTKDVTPVITAIQRTGQAKGLT